MTTPIGAAAAPLTSSRTQGAAAAPVDVIEQFRCKPLACWLLRGTCALKHDFHANGTSGQRLAACGRCELGAAHARGESPASWPDGSVVALRTLPASPVVNRPAESNEPVNEAAPSAEGRDDMPKKSPLYEYQGESKTVSGWARDPRNTAGLSGNGLRDRIVKGWSLHDALTTPRTDKNGGPKPTKGAKARRKRPSVKVVFGNPVLTASDGPAPSNDPVVAQIDEEIARLEHRIATYREARAVLARAS